MQMYRVYLTALAAVCVAIALPALAQQAPAQNEMLQPDAGAKPVSGDLLQPGAPYPGAGDTPIKLIPPSEIKHRTVAPQPPTSRPTFTVITPSGKTSPPKKAPAQTMEIISPEKPKPAMAKQLPAKTQANIAPSPAMPQPAPIIAEPAPTPASIAPSHDIPLELEPNSPDISVHGGAPGKTQANAPPAPAKASPTTAKISAGGTSSMIEPVTVTPQRTTPSIAASAPESQPQPQAQPAQVKVANAKPQALDHTGLVKRSQIMFGEGAVDPAPATITDLKQLASQLAGSLKGSGRVQLEAFGGVPGDKSSDARRLALKRALTVRALLIEDGVPAERIDVKALGGASDGGAPDRVDVFLRSS